jgi:dipeptidyl aminopeptidase/acylaminoacyl peptidase
MRKYRFLHMRNGFFLLLCLPAMLMAQKKPLDHSVYDGWQSIGERKISPDGQWAVYTIDVQEGDGQLVVQSTRTGDSRQFPRGYNATITPDSRFAIFRIRPVYADTRQARIKKKKPEDMPKDSLCILDLRSGITSKMPRVKAYKTPEKESGWLALHLEKKPVDSARKVSDTLRKKSDSSRSAIPPVVEQQPNRKQKLKQSRKEGDVVDDELPALAVFLQDPPTTRDAEGDEPGNAAAAEGTDLIVRNLLNGQEYLFPYVSDFTWSKNGKLLVIEGTPAKSIPSSLATVSVFRAREGRADTISRGANEYKNFAVDEDAAQVAFVAERDSSSKSLQKFYKLWHWQNGTDSARMIADRSMAGMPLNWTISEHANLSFSRNGRRLFFGTAPVRPPKDTSLVEIDLVKVDVWHYKDDYLQPQQLRNLQQELNRSYLAVYHIAEGRIVQLADQQVPQVMMGDEGNADQALGISDVGRRVEAQWEGRTKRDGYSIDILNGKRTKVVDALAGNPSISPAGKYIWWYDLASRQYKTWADGKTFAVSAGVKTALYDEQFDMPDYPSPYGLMRWMEQDEALLIYDRFDIWRLDPQARKAPVCLTKGEGRKTKTAYRYIQTDPEARAIAPGADLLLRQFNETTKAGGYAILKADGCCSPQLLQQGDYAFGQVVKAKDTAMYLFTRERYTDPADLYVSSDLKTERKLSSINPQQSGYNWGTAQLFSWKAYNGKQATGIVYLPEDFDPKKKYPMIAYFYERLSDGLHSYMAPAPTPSRLNIPFFVSRGYIVLAPDIEYTTGYPGKAAYDYVVSGARALVKKGWVDSTRMGLQGQSWGGYQTAYIITRTKLFRAAWAGAPVANMTSAYGGIRWESGLNRQFQYEHSQSRIGSTLWEKQKLYLENSPLFYLPQVSTPLVIMANDADGAVPWYQGIELFTGLRRLGKPVWMLNYNGEAHNLVERKNRKDIQVREQQFFDWLLKGEKPSPWITDGVPATEKGRSWGL